MKTLLFDVVPQASRKSFKLHHLGFHDRMRPGMINRPTGTNDYLFMLFYTEVQVKTALGDEDVAPPALIVSEPPDSHYYGNPERPWDHSWFHCSGDMIRSILNANHIPLRTKISLSDPFFMEHFLLEVIAEIKNWEKPDEQILRSLFEIFVRALARNTSKKTKQFAPSRLLEIRAHIEQHFNEELRLNELARQASYSEGHLSSEFRHYFGVSIIQFALRLRMKHASYLLRNQNHRISEIANAVGYPDIFTFSKMFKRHMGLSPSDFRKRLI